MTTRAVERTIRTALHGRYLVSITAAHDARSAPVLAGFHGYAEDAAAQMARLQAAADPERWLMLSVQALHTFYRGRSQDVVASWMTRKDRDLMIADNLTYVSAVLGDAAGTPAAGRVVVFAGFSQGVAMAFRAAALGPQRVSAVVALGADVPPELTDEALGAIPAVLLGRGNSDQWYTPEMYEADVARLTKAGVDVTRCEFDGAHEWTPAFSERAADFIGRLLQAS